MRKTEPETIKPIKVERGEGYVFKAEDFGDDGCKITLIDPRDLDILDRDRHHAVILSHGELTILRRFISEVEYVQKFKRA